MKLRACAPALLLSVVGPAVLTEAGLTSVPLCEPQSFAQAPDAVTEVARQRYEEGVKAYDTGRFEDARAAFLQAYALKRHPAVLLNLGQSELRSNHPEDAGNHLQQFLREHKAATPDQKAAAEKGIADAKRRTGFIIVIADANAADVSVDGSAIGKAPLFDPVFVAPGKHTVFATYQGKSATTQVDARAGSAAAATLTLGTTGAAAAPAPAPAPAAPVTSSPAKLPAGAPAAAPAAPAQASAPSGNGFTFSTSTMGTTGSDQASGGREPLLRWYTRKPLAWVGTGVTGVGLIIGIVGSASASSASSNADYIAQKIRDYAADNPDKVPLGRTDQPCGSRDQPEADLPAFKDACAQLRAELDSHDSALPWAYTGWILAGVGVVGTAAYVMLDWYPKEQHAEIDAPRVTAIAPVLAPGQAGIGVAGTF
jgi:hypothetical protein